MWLRDTRVSPLKSQAGRHSARSRISAAHDPLDTSVDDLTDVSALWRIPRTAPAVREIADAPPEYRPRGSPECLQS
jgi:hypothetical protein